MSATSGSRRKRRRGLAAPSKFTRCWRRRPAARVTRCWLLDRVADLAQDRADLVAQEDQRDDGNDGDQGEDQRVLGEALAVFVAAEAREERVNERHVERFSR